jgi:DHA1 family multidrug resistance protein-like MFS transporter
MHKATLSPQDLTPRQQQIGILTVMVDWFLMNAGFFLIIPLVSVHFVDELGWAAAFIGLVLAVRQFTQQGLTVFGGALADSVGPKQLILLGVLIRSASFVMMGYATVPWVLLLSGFLAAVGGALFDAPQKATLAALAPPEELTALYGRVGILQNVARTVGPLIGAALIAFDFRVVGLGAAAFFMLAFVVTWIALPPVTVCSDPQSGLRGLRFPLADRTFVVFTALMMGFWFMWVQLSIALPLQVKHLTGDTNSVGLLFTVSAVLAIVLQVPALKLAERVLQPIPIIITGLVAMGVGLGLVGLTHSLFQFYVALFFFSLGTVLVLPSSQTVIAEMANPRARGAYFGVSSLALAVGGGLGHISGGSLVDIAAQRQMPLLPWATFAAVGLAAAVGMALFYWYHQAHAPQTLSHAPVSGD